MEIEIKRVGNDGEGIGYYENKPVFVYYAYKDEIVDISLYKNRRGAYEGKINKIIKPSIHRVKPKCPYYGQVGTSNLMHISYNEQLNYKREFVKYHIERNIKEHVNILETVPAYQEFYYRNKIDVPVRKIKGKNKMGLFIRGTNNFLPIRHYVLHQKELDEAANLALSLMDKYKIDAYNRRHNSGYVSNLSIRSNIDEEVQLTFILSKDVNLDELVKELTNKNKKIVSVYKVITNRRNNRDLFSGKMTKLYGDKYLKMEMANYSFFLTPDSFFQLHTNQALRLFHAIIEHGKLHHNDVVLDAYSGVGTIASFISPFVKEVVAIERVKSAVDANIHGNMYNMITNMRPLVGDVTKVVKGLNMKFDVMVFDPPREGLKEELLNFILKEKPTRIIYASCNPETLGTDLKVLSKKYSIEKILPLDMFPQTSHTESVTFLTLKK